MEGPSGLHEIDETVRKSHGIIGLAGDGCAAAMFTVDHTAYDSSFSVCERQGLYSSETILTAGINLEGTHRTSSGKQKLPDIHLVAGEDVVSCMKRAAGTTTTKT